MKPTPLPSSLSAVLDHVGLSSAAVHERLRPGLSPLRIAVELLSEHDGERGAEQRLAQALAESQGLRCALTARDLQPDTAWLAKLPLRVWAAANALPIRGTAALTVAIDDPLESTGIDGIRVAAGGILPEVVVAPRGLLQDALREHLGVGADTVQQLVGARGDDSTGSASVDLGDASEDASIIRLVNQLLTEALDRRATDVHIEPFEGRLSVRYRIDGELAEARLPPEARRLQAAIVSRLKILANLDIAEKRLPQDGRMQVRMASRTIDVRLSVIPMLHGEAAVLRLLDRSTALVGLPGTGMASRDLTPFQRALDLPHGIVLVTGPTGSGKTSTLYAGLSRINTIGLKIVTIEDPVEYHLDGVNQIQVDTKTGLSFATGLRSILRHDPDVILVGEIRDRETAEIAVQASLTGHLVLSTLHTNDAPGAIARLVDMGIEPYLVASTLELVLAQRLVRLLCSHCKTELPHDERADALRLLPGHQGPLFGPVGCRECGGSGYRGRSGIFETMPMSSSLRHLAGERVPAPELRRQALADGMLALRDDGLRLVREGRTSLSEILRLTREESLGAAAAAIATEVP